MYWEGWRREASWAGAWGAAGWAGTGQEQQGHVTRCHLATAVLTSSATRPSQRQHSKAQRSQPLSRSSCSFMCPHIPTCCSVSCPGTHLLCSLRTHGSTLLQPGGMQPQPETQTICHGSKPLQMGKKRQGGQQKRFGNPCHNILYSVVFNLCSLPLEIVFQSTAYILTKSLYPWEQQSSGNSLCAGAQWAWYSAGYRGYSVPRDVRQLGSPGQES